MTVKNIPAMEQRKKAYPLKMEKSQAPAPRNVPALNHTIGAETKATITAISAVHNRTRYVALRRTAIRNSRSTMGRKVIGED